MSGRVLHLFPKYSTLVGGAPAGSGGQDFFSPPFEVVPFKTLVLEALLLGATGGTVKVQLQEGSDLEFDNWTALGSEETLAAGTVSPVTATSPARYVRARVNLSIASGTMAVTFWVIATAREV